MKRLFFIIALVCSWAGSAHAQVPVAPLQLVRQQFLSATGIPLAGGCLTFNATGTSTPQAIYTDSSGQFQAPNPYQLDSAGESNIWLSNTGYDLTAYAGVPNTPCSTSLGSQLWQQKNINPFTIINSGSNYIVASGTSDPGGVPGELGYLTTIPCFRGFTTIWDCFTQNAAIQTLTNKTLTNPTITAPTVTGGTVTGSPSLNGTLQVNGPATYVTFPNNPIPGTTNGNLMKLTGTPSAITAPANTDTGGVIGILVTGQGGGGTFGTVQQTGIAPCIFDGATTAGDYVQLSPTTGGQCHDAGASKPAIGQVVGRVTTTNAVAGTYLVDLFSPEITGGQVGAATGCTTIGPVTVTNNNALQNLLSCVIPANTLSAGSLLNVDVTGIQSAASGTIAVTFNMNLGGGTPCLTPNSAIIANNEPWNVVGKFAVLTAGAGGTANWSCEGFVGGTTPVAANGGVGTPTISINTTIPNTLLIAVQMSVANAGNTTVAQLLKAVIY